MRLTHLISLFRPEQYYKNLVIFLAIYFSGNLLNLEHLAVLLPGFVALCLLSSANYVINDIADRNNDRFNQEKNHRPLAKRDVSVTQALGIAVMLLIFSFVLAYVLSIEFFIAELALLILATLYSFYLKNELFVDIIIISVNFVIRAVAGALLIGVWVSPWLVIGTFFLALFLAAGKRKSERAFLKHKAAQHRPLLASYSDEILNFLLQTSTTLLLMSYTLYSFLGSQPLLFITLPIVLYVILRYLHLIQVSSPITRSVYKIFTDKKIVAAGLLYLATSLIVLYYP